MSDTIIEISAAVSKMTEVNLLGIRSIILVIITFFFDHFNYFSGCTQK